MNDRTEVYDGYHVASQTMTINITLPEANSQFLELINRIKTGEEVLIFEAGISIARISPINKSQQPRVPGQDKGRIFISPDFDDPLPSDILDSLSNFDLLYI
jgi:antitoxin (DNA-binding transcriptional repressor) of toxin-antitoxin stability system